MISNMTGSLTKIATSLPELFTTMSTNSLSEYTAATRMQPLVIIDATIRDQDFMTELLMALVNINAGFVLQSVALSNSVGQVKVRTLLDPFNNDRSLTNALAEFTTRQIGVEDYKHGLPNYSQGIESTDSKSPRVIMPKDVVKELSTNANLAVGKTFEVPVSDGTNTIPVVMSIRLIPLTLSPENINAVYSSAAYANTYVERFWDTVAGKLGIIDFITCNDQVERHQRNLINDKSGFYELVHKRRRKNKIVGVITGKPSVNTAANIAIISEDTALQLQRNLGGSFDNGKIRARVFAESELQILVVVDPEWGRFKFYYRGVDGFSELTLAELKSANKGSGPDVAGVLRDFMSMKSPSF